jgi:hypothetical protein
MINILKKIEPYTFYVVVLIMLVSAAYIYLHPLEFISGGREGDFLEYSCYAYALNYSQEKWFIASFEGENETTCYISKLPHQYPFRQDHPSIWLGMILGFIVFYFPTFYLFVLRLREKFKNFER